MSELSALTKVPLGRYGHYKVGEHEVLGVARHSETHEALVVYGPLYKGTGWWVDALRFHPSRRAAPD